MRYLIMVILQFTPFWAIPIAMIAFQFAYLYWLKDRREVTILLGGIIAVCVGCLIFYVWVGGHPGVEKAILDG